MLRLVVFAVLGVYRICPCSFFRDPAREIPQNPEAVLSPVDGRIVVVERARDPYRDVDALKISIFYERVQTCIRKNRLPIVR